MTEKPNAITLNILAKRDGDLWVGHCLELDIVAAADTLEALKADLNDLITAQIDYAFSNDHLTHLFRSAPAEVCAEFYRCRRIAEDQIEIAKSDNASSFVPPWIIANTCLSENSCVAYLFAFHPGFTPRPRKIEVNDGVSYGLVMWYRSD